MILPVVALVGRPNVGKSTLFNKLTNSKSALVVDIPGATRDRQYGQANIDDKPFIVIDTGGIITYEKDSIVSKMYQQMLAAVSEANVIFFVVDAKDGLTIEDKRIAAQLRKLPNKNILVIINKTDGQDENIAISEFFELGFTANIPIAAKLGRGVRRLITIANKQWSQITLTEPSLTTDEKIKGIRIAIVGKPNVGKSTLVNRMIGEERVIAFDAPGTTRDSIYLPFSRQNQDYTIIDTAGIRKKSKVTEVIEKFSVIKTLQAIEACDVVVLVLDAKQGLADQDLTILEFILNIGKALVITINKWDGMSTEQKIEFKKTLQEKLKFLDFVTPRYISALHGTNVGHLFSGLQEAFQASIQDIKTTKLTKALEAAVLKYPPPVVQKHRIKLRYAHQGGKQPPLIVIHGNQADKIPTSYKRYLIKEFRKSFDFAGTPIQITLRTNTNPYAGKGNTLTDTQRRKRNRLKKFNKRNN